MATALRTCWDVGELSFQTLVQASAERKIRPADAAVMEVNSGMPMPCDELMPLANCVETWRVSIAKSSAIVWPWLCQMMRGGGMYGWEVLESPTRRSACRLLPGIPPPRVGDRLGNMFEIIQVEPGAAILWRLQEPLSTFNHTIDDLTLAYRIHPNGPDQCTLTSRVRCRFDLTTRQVSTYVCRLLGLILPVCQLMRIKQLAESAPPYDESEQRTVSSNGAHQAMPFLAATGKTAV